MEADLTTAAVAKAIAVKRGQKAPTINRRRLLWYRYEAAQRTDATPGQDADREGEGDETFRTGSVPTLPLPAVPDTVVEGMHYLCWEVLFTLDVPGHVDLNWRALLEVNTGAVLYLRALTASADGCVYLHDPLTQANSTADCSSSNATLNALRTTVSPLEGLKPPVMGNQALDGDLVVVSDTDAPVDAPPTAASPYSFCYDVKDTDLWAVNAYHHSDFVFRLVEDMGFTLSSYFDGTTFPVPVDHVGMATVNAQAPGNATGTGLQKFRFGWACSGGEIGIAVDQRIVLHEFGHALLWDHVGSPNFGFAHSAGDALAAIIHDPGSQAPDRFETFPWVTAMNPLIDRRHDRDPSAGWAWFGSSWNTQYGGEQVLSTTLFRLYQSLGGGATWHPPSQAWASRYTTFLILKAIGTLTATTPDPEVYATALMNADLTELDFEGRLRCLLSGLGAGIVLVGCHLDSTASRDGGYDPVTDPAPGADDDASGIAGTLAVARWMWQFRNQLRHQVRFAFFNAEEAGLVGSAAYAAHMAALGAPIEAVVCMDMIGHNTDTDRVFEVHSGATAAAVRDASDPIAARIAAWTSALGSLPAPQLYRGTNPGPGTDRNTFDGAINRSDHASFQANGFPAVLASEDFFANLPTEPASDANPSYHRAADTAVDASYGAAIACVVAHAVRDIAATGL